MFLATLLSSNSRAGTIVLENANNGRKCHNTGVLRASRQIYNRANFLLAGLCEIPVWEVSAFLTKSGVERQFWQKA
jgi:hypothetical protein